MAWIASWSDAVNGRRRSRVVSSSTGPSSRSTGGRIVRSERSHLFDTDPARRRKAAPTEALWGAMDLMPSSIALLFPGQGSHAEGMEDPYRGHPLMERGLQLLGYDPFERLSGGTRSQQPALFLCSVAAWDAWRAEPPEDEAGDAIAAAGHSLGEYAALVAAGALEFDDAVKLVDERATAMADAGEQRSGGMIAFLGGESRDVRALADRLGLVIANDNAPGQLVLSGPVAPPDAAEEVAREETGARVRRLDVTGAFHSPLMEPAADRLRAALDRTPGQPRT